MNISKLLQKFRVPLGFLFAIAFLLFAQPRLEWLIPGSALALVGVMIRIWAAGHLRKHQRLSVAGPYRWTRNPLYLGSFVLGLGLSLATANLFITGAFAILFALVYIPVMKQEERELSDAYGEDYLEYRKAVPLFLPGLAPAPPNSSQQFSWQQVNVNREYNAAIGYCAVVLYLAVRIYW